MKRIREERNDYYSQFEHLNLSIADEGRSAVKKMFELAIDAKSRWKTLSREERVDYLKKVCSNPVLDEANLRYEMKKPFARLASWKGNSKWRREAHILRTEAIEWITDVNVINDSINSGNQ